MLPPPSPPPPLGEALALLQPLGLAEVEFPKERLGTEVAVRDTAALPLSVEQGEGEALAEAHDVEDGEGVDVAE